MYARRIKKNKMGRVRDFVDAFVSFESARLGGTRKNEREGRARRKWIFRPERI